MMMASPVAADFLETAAPATVWLVVLSFVFVECAIIVGLFLPGDSLLLTAGVILAQHHHHVGAWALAVTATIVAVAGNQVGYLIGKKTGVKILARKDGRMLNRENLQRARDFLDRWGFWSVVVARWLPWVRTLAPMIAGAAGMNNRRFILANTIGAVVWVPTLIMLGYYGAGLLREVPWLTQVALIVTIGFFVLGTGYGLFRYRQEMRKPVDTDEFVPEARTPQG
jgi:membrane-associated protein